MVENLLSVSREAAYRRRNAGFRIGSEAALLRARLAVAGGRMGVAGPCLPLILIRG